MYVQMRSHPVRFYEIIAIAEDKNIAHGLYRPHIAGVTGSGALGCIYHPQGIGSIVAFDHGASVIGTAVIAHEYLKTGVTCLNGEGIKLLQKAGTLTITPDEASSLAARLAKLATQPTPSETAELADVARARSAELAETARQLAAAAEDSAEQSRKRLRKARR